MAGTGWDGVLVVVGRAASVCEGFCEPVAGAYEGRLGVDVLRVVLVCDS